jgi:glycosyltransferase involved in cell wall biosynthesis
MGNALTSRPYQMRKYCQPEPRRRLQELVSTKHYDAILCDFLLTADVAPWRAGVPTVIFAHNVEAALWRRRVMMARNPLWKLVAWREHRTIARAERHLTELADHVLAVSDEDRELFLEFLPPDKVSTIPTGVDLNYFRPAKSPENCRLAFTGSMDWLPNEDAILYFSNEILPLIQREEPDVSLSVIGKNPTPKLRTLAARNQAIRLTGAVDDIRPHVQEASVYVVPLRIGGGTRIKIFEAMAMGKAVVSTTIGAEGLPVKHGRDIVLADAPEEFARSTVNLLRQQKERERIGQCARRLVENGHSWPEVTDVVEKTLARVVACRETQIR